MTVPDDVGTFWPSRLTSTGLGVSSPNTPFRGPIAGGAVPDRKTRVLAPLRINTSRLAYFGVEGGLILALFYGLADLTP